MMRPQLRQLFQHTESVRLGLAAFGSPAQRKNIPNTPRKNPTQSRGPSGPPNRRPAKPIDARSFAAPTAGTDQPRIIRSPRLRNVRGNQGPGQGPRKPMAKGKGKNQKPRQRRPREAKKDDGDIALEEAEEAAINQIEQDQALKERPVPVRYEPRDIDFASLKATWPSIPSDANARSVAVLQKLSGLSDRYANGYIPPYELGRRVWKGESVLFENEIERSEALAEVKSPVSAEDSKILIEKWAQGKYPALTVGKDQPAAMGDVLRNLRNNGTYETAGKRPQFIAKVESLLSSSRVKRT
ncbi:hypothetical protein N7450_001212 [Penicillium hetheringtonii]|uniref:Uncharacterized protein n=1 Tax=Penicillium hetheringtonii TaxID=911720 RepID=A0AAD6E4Y4_9EURO|nr:hypothetical protein N7450_001212 [Penicillium hetheringtonii]